MTAPVLEPQVIAEEPIVQLSHGAQLAAALDGPPTAEETTPPVVVPPVSAEPAAPVTPVTPDPSTPPPVDDVQELRQIVRSLMRQNADLKSYMQRVRTAPAPAASVQPPSDPLDEVFGIKTAPPKVETPPETPPTRYEELQQSLGYIGATKGPLLDTLVATMEMNSQFQDIRAVCSRDNLDTLVEQAAKRYVAANPGSDFVEATMEIELAIWSQQNPYKYMYDAIKATNPKFGGTDGKPSAAAPLSAAAQAALSGPVPVVAPTSIIPLGGSDADKSGGWTADKIDAMDDESYAKLPEEVRMKFLAGDFNVK
jgi:hypothetical protein